MNMSKYDMEEIMQRINKIASVLGVLGFGAIILAIVVLVILIRDGYEFLEIAVSMASFVVPILFLFGFAEIIQILHEIRAKVYKKEKKTN